MFLKKLFYPFVCIALSGLFFTACDDDEGFPEGDTPGDGKVVEAIIVNEGQWQKNLGSLSVIYKDGTSNIDVFRQVNNRPLGDQTQDITCINDMYFVPLGSSQKVEVVDPSTFESKGTILFEQPSMPQHIVAISDNKAVVSDLKNQLTVISTVAPYGKATECIPVESVVSYMLMAEGKLFAMTQDGVMVYNPDALAAGPVKKFSDVVPMTDKTKFNLDKRGILWVLGWEGSDGTGYPNGQDGLTLTGINTQTLEVAKKVNIPVATGAGIKSGDIVPYPSFSFPRTDMVEDDIYFTVRTASEDGSDENSLLSVFVFNTQNFEYRHVIDCKNVHTMYGFGVSPAREIYVLDCLDFSPLLGYAHQYKADGSVVSINVGVFPTDVYFPDKHK